MKHQKILRSLILVLLFALALSGCAKKTDTAPAAGAPTAAPTPEPVRFAGGDVAAGATELRMSLAAGELALLDSLPALRSADLSGSAEEEAVAAWAARHPEISVRYTVTLPNGTRLASDTQELDLSGAAWAEIEAAAPKLGLLPGLRLLRLGSASDGRLSWDNIAALRRALPDTVFQYAFQIYGRDCDLSSETISLFHAKVDDSGRFIDQVIGYMPQLIAVDMDGCGLEPLRLEEINLKHPDTKVIFRVFFGNNYSVRTDVERILASMPSKGGMIDKSNYEGLFYCHDVRFLDLGHNTDLTDISFVAQMPKLEVAILSMCNWSDASPLAYCKELEYLEMTNTYCTDLRPLSGLTKLRHLNVAATGFDQPQDGSERIRLKDITPLYPLTQLERLWIGAFNPVPSEQVEEMQRRAPQCEINTEVYEDPVGGRWRYIELADYINTYVDTNHPRYVKLREQFGDYAYSAYCFSWNDPAYSEDAAAPSVIRQQSAQTQQTAEQSAAAQTPEPAYEQQESYQQQETYQQESYQQEQESYQQEQESYQQEQEETYQDETAYSSDPYQSEPMYGDADDGADDPYGQDAYMTQDDGQTEQGDSGFGDESALDVALFDIELPVGEPEN